MADKSKLSRRKRDEKGCKGQHAQRSIENGCKRLDAVPHVSGGQNEWVILLRWITINIAKDLANGVNGRSGGQPMSKGQIGG